MLRRVTDPDDSILAEEISPNCWRVYNFYEEHDNQEYPYYQLCIGNDLVKIRAFAERRWKEYSDSRQRLAD